MYQTTNFFEAVATSGANQIYSILISQKGRALKPTTKFMHVNQNQFLQQYFYKEYETGHKSTAHCVVKMMIRVISRLKEKKNCPETI